MKSVTALVSKIHSQIIVTLRFINCVKVIWISYIFTAGLSHSPSTDSVMFPYYQGFANEVAGNVALGYDDIMAMYNLYSKRKFNVTLLEI